MEHTIEISVGPDDSYHNSETTILITAGKTAQFIKNIGHDKDGEY